jgi:hypothetical protein
MPNHADDDPIAEDARLSDDQRVSCWRAVAEAVAAHRHCPERCGPGRCRGPLLWREDYGSVPICLVLNEYFLERMTTRHGLARGARAWREEKRRERRGRPRARS